MADRVVGAIAVLFVAFLLPYLFQWYRAHYTYDDVLHDVDANEELALHSEEFEQPNVIMAAKGVYVAIGYALANSILIEAPEGNIVVDTTEAVESGEKIRAAFRNVSDRPIKAIIYTHNHPDHTFGAQAFVDDPSAPPEIWAHHSLVGQLQRIALTGPLIYRRSIRQFGRFLKPPAHLNSGIGPRLHYDDKQQGVIYPNRLLEKPEEDVVIAGLRLRLLHLPGETADQLGVWVPHLRALLIADNVYRAFPNLYAIRGTPARDVTLWARSLDRALELDPVLLVPSHTKPIGGAGFGGREAVQEVLGVYRDAIQFVHDQTVRWMNKGEHPTDIARKVKLPRGLGSHPYLQQYYGTVEWSVKGVFDSYMGWFSGDVTELQPLATKDKAGKMVELAGGVTSMVAKAQEAFDDGEVQWALELASYVVTANPGHHKALKLRLKCLRSLAAQQTSANGRNYLLTVALEDHGLVDGRTKFSKLIMRIPMSQIFTSLATRVKGEECGETDIAMDFNFTDTHEFFSVHLRNGVMVVREGEGGERGPRIRTPRIRAPDVVVSVPALEWRRTLGKRAIPVMAYLRGELAVEGSLWTVIQFFQCLDRTQ